MRSIIFLSVAFLLPLSAIQYDIDHLLKTSLENSAFLDAKNLQIKASGLMIDQAKVWGNPTLSGDFGTINQNDISGFSYSFRVSQPVFFPVNKSCAQLLQPTTSSWKFSVCRSVSS